ncbi:MAG: ABC transporter permease [Acidobacteriota bacterium]
MLLALRYLRSTRRDAFTSFLSAVAGGGIALGVAALILALAALAGFQQALKTEILARTPELEIELPPGADSAAVARAAAATPGVRGAEAVLHGRGWAIVAGDPQPVDLVGFAGRVPRSFPGAAGLPVGLYLGDSLALRFGLRPGDPVEIASTRPTLTPLGPQPRLRTLPLAGTYSTGRTEQDRRVALPWSTALALLGTGDTRVEVEASDLDAALRAAPAIAAKLPAGCRVRTWRELNQPLFFALRLEKTVMFAAVFLIVLVAGLALVADVALVIVNKRSEIGMLGAMGASAADLRRTFLWLGMLLGGAGGALGAALGLAAAFVLDRYRLIALPERVYFLDYVPFRVLPLDLATVLGLTLILTLGCAAGAAARAAALRPVEALRR